MAGWPILKDGSVACDDEKRDAVQGNEDDQQRVIGQKRDDDDGKLRNLFAKVLLNLQLKFNVENNIKRPIQAVLGSGQSVDLFKLFCLVKQGGGLDLVSNQYQWGSIGQQLGFNPKVSASLKLIYIKYLDVLDQCFNMIFRDENFSNNTEEYDGNLGLLAVELEKKFQCLSNYKNGQKMEGGNNVLSKYCSRISEQGDTDPEETLNVALNLGENTNDLGGDITKFTVGDNDDSNMVKIDVEEKGAMPDAIIVERQMISGKRKREGLDQMLAWMYHVAKNPFDPLIGRIPECSKWKENKGNEPWSLAIAMRESHLKRKYPDSSHICPFLEQKKHRVNPSMYDDSLATRHPDGLRFSRRIPILAKTPLCSCRKGSVHKQSNLPTINSKPIKLNKSANIYHQKIEEIEQSPLAAIKPPPTPADDFELSSFEQQQRMRKRVSVNVGPRYQAEILSWTGQTSESDSRWLGTLVWPPQSKSWGEKSTRPLPTMEEPVGKVCDKTCDCEFPGLVECVRFHTAEKRLMLKLELGRAFYLWKFDTMGEIVSLAWSPEEEEEFKKVMTTSPMLRLGKSTFLVKKTRMDLIDYFFNVFLQRKRCYQNRTTPMEVDSDDELSEFGTVGGLYGDAAIRASGSNPRVCTLNEQCWDFSDEDPS